MAEEFSVFGLLSRLGMALSRRKFPPFCLKPLQVKFFEHALKGLDVIAVLPTGFGKSLLFQLLPDFLPVKGEKNIVLVVCPLNSIIEDQLKVLEERGISADVLQLSSDQTRDCESLFPSDQTTCVESECNAGEAKLKSPNEKIVNGDVQIVFAHPEALLSKEGRKLMNGDVYKRNVVACVVDEAHYVEIW
jgi:ATP-dependent DNA helicase RecQ